jgi:hypothetical protein
MRGWTNLLAGALLLAGCWTVVGAGDAARPGSTLTIVAEPGMDAALIERMRAWVQTNYEAVTVVRVGTWTNNASRTEVVAKLKEGRQASEAFVLGVASFPGENLRNSLTQVLDTPFVIMNVAPVLAADPTHPERLGDRLEREALRAVALWLNLPPVPTSLCATGPHTTIADLDAKSRSLMPPTALEAKKRLAQRGLAMLSNDPSVLKAAK